MNDLAGLGRRNIIRALLDDFFGFFGGSIIGDKDFAGKSSLSQYTLQNQLKELWLIVGADNDSDVHAGILSNRWIER